MSGVAKAAVTGLASAFGALLGSAIGAQIDLGTAGVPRTASDVDKDTLKTTVIGAAVGALVCGATAGAFGDPHVRRRLSRRGSP